MTNGGQIVNQEVKKIIKEEVRRVLKRRNCGKAVVPSEIPLSYEDARRAREYLMTGGL